MSATISETHEFSVGEGARLEIQNRAGNVTIARGSGGQVRVVVTKRTRGLFGSASEADLQKLRVEVTQSGDTVNITTERGVDWSLFKQVTVDLDITAPEAVELDLRLNAGNIRVNDTVGGVRAEVNAGNARFTFPADAGIAVEGRTTAGSIHSSVEQIGVSRHFASASASGTLGTARGSKLRATVDAGNLSFDAS